MSKFLLVPLALALSLIGCAKAEAGDPCDAGQGQCESSSSALLCDNGKLRLFQCRGSAACVDTTTKDVCDFGSFLAGDACPAEVEGKAQCDTANANQALKCTSGTMQAQACKACALQSGNIVCQP